MSTTKRMIAACTALTICIASFALPASAKSLVERNQPHRGMMMRHHMMPHHRGMKHHRAMRHHRRMMHRGASM